MLPPIVIVGASKYGVTFEVVQECWYSGNARESMVRIERDPGAHHRVLTLVNREEHPIWRGVDLREVEVGESFRIYPP
jgi:hypothetical protein